MIIVERMRKGTRSCSACFEEAGVIHKFIFGLKYDDRDLPNEEVCLCPDCMKELQSKLIMIGCMGH